MLLLKYGQLLAARVFFIVLRISFVCVKTQVFARMFLDRKVR